MGVGVSALWYEAATGMVDINKLAVIRRGEPRQGDDLLPLQLLLGDPRRERRVIIGWFLTGDLFCAASGADRRASNTLDMITKFPLV